jgi:hypothetical protein
MWHIDIDAEFNDILKKDKEKIGVDAQYTSSNLGASIVTFKSEEDMNLYRLLGTLKETECVWFICK